MELRLKLKVKDVEIELSVDEARKLAELLAGLVGEKRTDYVPYTVPVPWWDQWPYPWHVTAYANTWGGESAQIYSVSDGVSVTVS